MSKSKSKTTVSRRPAVCVTVLLIAAMILGFAGCATNQAAPTAGPDPNSNPQAAYLKACRDAKTVTPSKVEKDLRAITAWEPGLVWEGDPGSSRVKVVTSTKKDFYDNSVGKDYNLPTDANVWVTLYPDLKNFVRENGGSVKPQRIEQLLGLPPGNNATKVIELWVNPSDVFRPSPDPETNDHEADVNFPTGNNKFLTFNDSSQAVEWDNGANADKTYTYQQWFENRKNTIYTGQYPYPWTRLGYTYDWGTSARNHEGLSEFVILGGSTLGVGSVIPTSQYLKVK